MLKSILTSVMTRSAIVALLCSLSLSAYAVADNTVKRPINIPPQNLATALEQLSRQSGTDLVYRPEQVRGYHTHSLVGTFSAEEAVRKLLEGTPLTLSTDSSGALLIAAPLTSSSRSNSGSEPQTPSSSPPPRDRLQLAQATPGQAQGNVSVEKQDEQASKKKFVQLEEVVVTGSRIPSKSNEGAQNVLAYSREQIEDSGQRTLSDFLNTLPSVSVQSVETSVLVGKGSTTVQLRGLPLGATLVLLNGRRLQTSGTQIDQDFFDLNNVPLAAVERIEVLADGSSAIYGSDAVAGVVNIILKRNFDGFEFNTRYGGATDIHESNTSLAWGKRWDKGSLSIIGSYQTRDELVASDRSLTATSDYRAFGGADRNGFVCNPGNVFSPDGSNLPGLSAPYAAVPVGFTGTPSIQEFRATAGTLNECSAGASSSIVPATHRTGVFVQGSHQLTPSIELFTELLYSHVEELVQGGYQQFYGQPGFQSFTVAASNPYNPFGETVGISLLLNSLPRTGLFYDTDFFRPLVGARGTLFENWHWELTAWQSEDLTDNRQPGRAKSNFFPPNATNIQAALNSSDPATALNPFINGSPGPQSQLQSFYHDAHGSFTGRGQAVNGFVRGPVLRLPSGPVELVAGAEYDRSAGSFELTDSFGQPAASYHRHSYSVFGEARIPLLAKGAESDSGARLATTLAARFDHYGDFGSVRTPQYGIEWRPADALLVRATYAEAFKAPSLSNLFGVQQTFVNAVLDPATGKIDPNVSLVFGGNPDLRPQTGRSHTLGFVYSSKVIPDLRLSVSYWNVVQDNTISNVPYNDIVANSDLFPGRVIRAPSCAGAPPCPITAVNATLANFGQFNVAGFDYQLDYRSRTNFGVWTPALSATQTRRYSAALTAAAPATDRLSRANDDGNWAPRWKGSISLRWALGDYAATLAGRYLASYRDADALPNGTTLTLGNFWLFDASFRYNAGQALAPNSTLLKGTYVAIGGVNVLNRAPQFSNFNSGFTGYDPTQVDLRGRIAYVEFGGKF